MLGWGRVKKIVVRLLYMVPPRLWDGDEPFLCLQSVMRWEGLPSIRVISCGVECDAFEISILSIGTGLQWVYPKGFGKGQFLPLMAEKKGIHELKDDPVVKSRVSPLL